MQSVVLLRNQKSEQKPESPLPGDSPMAENLLQCYCYSDSGDSFKKC